jgi:hypothetical protein
VVRDVVGYETAAEALTMRAILNSPHIKAYIDNPRGHVWQTGDDGELDIFAYGEGEYCNGPLCVKCGYGFCHHCHSDGAEHDCSEMGKGESL